MQNIRKLISATNLSMQMVSFTEICNTNSQLGACTNVIPVFKNRLGQEIAHDTIEAVQII